ncbi:hypothetical protein L2E82_16050 [Cichorium intybus]|uniref:Uncharacterized protein n=1 Tax=Cichorium intybus TaxID=13427 RepID=A0ACB9F5R9_CICIN|nr:hypothetical protein L2E82_16050 [Cichorium intybus]
MAFYLLLSYLLPSVIQYAFTNAAGGSSWQGRKFQWINGGASTTSTIGGSAGSRETKSAIPQRGGKVNLTLGGINLNNSGSVVVREDKKLLTVLFPGGRDGLAFTRKLIRKMKKRKYAIVPYKEKLENELKELDKRLEQKEAEMKRVAGGDTSVLKQHYEKKVQDLEHEKRALQSAIPQRGGKVNLTLGGIDLNNSGSVVVREDKKLLTVLFPGGRDGLAFTRKVFS